MLRCNHLCVILEPSQITLLKKGLSFTRTPTYDLFTWVKDVHLFAHKLAHHEYYLSCMSDMRVKEERMKL